MLANLSQLTTLPRNAITKVRWQLSDRRNYRAISRLSVSGYTADINTMAALSAAVDFKYNRISAEEKPFIDTIEDLRLQYINSTEKLGTEKLSQVCSVGSKGANACRLLFLLLRRLNPEFCLELGTSVGISTAYIATALKANGRGQLISAEGNAARHTVGARTIHALQLEANTTLICDRFEQVVEQYIPSTFPRLDFALIDGHHDGQATLWYFEKLAPLFRKGGVLVFSGIYWSKGMNKAWNTIKSSSMPGMTFELKGMGFVVMRGER